MKEYALNQLKQKYGLKKRNMGDLAVIKKGMYRFDSEAYEIEGVGNLFIIEMKAMLGLMKMETIVLTPVEKDLSFCNLDTIDAMGNTTSMFEMYDTCIKAADLSSFDPVKEKYAHLQDYESSPRWYDEYKLSSCIAKKGKKIKDEAEGMLKECFGLYLELLDKAEDCNPSRKKEKNKVYAEGLLSNGGAAVDSMNKIIGPEKTSELIRKFMYAVD